MYFKAFNPKEQIQIPTQWVKDVKKLKERQETGPQGLIFERAEFLKEKNIDKPIKKPAYFLRDIEHLISHINKIKDPTRLGILEVLIRFKNDIMPALRKGEAILPKSFQDQVIAMASKLKDDGTLLTLIGNLFSETYKRASISDIIRKIVQAFIVQA